MEDPGILTRDSLSKLVVGAVFHDNKKHINSIDFDHTGQFCVTSSDDESLHLYDCERGTKVKTSNSKKYGCNLAKFTHHKNCIIYASTKEDDAIRYMSFHDNKFIRYFKGHQGNVTSLDMSPLDDRFISAASDSSVRLWDLRTENAQGFMQVPNGNPLVAFDPSGKVFAIALQSKVIRLYDIASFENGPFVTGAPTHHLQTDITWTGIKFSNDGNYILISTNGPELYVVSGLDPKELVAKLTGHQNLAALDLHADFTPDAKFAMCGSQDGKVHFWEIKSQQLVCSLDGHTEGSKVVAYNPKFNMAASADANLAFWIPPPPGAMPEGD
ncbi:WD40-repeat-containing domain protein [Hyaloraphidium curvatum]|nr:WD40-repeat-containing domain protein [Hyaloraphidium curvatum]